jgi:hypothetical protein
MGRAAELSSDRASLVQLRLFSLSTQAPLSLTSPLDCEIASLDIAN